jgi:hypothetical protein
VLNVRDRSAKNGKNVLSRKNREEMSTTNRNRKSYLNKRGKRSRSSISGRVLIVVVPNRRVVVVNRILIVIKAVIIVVTSK